MMRVLTTLSVLLMLASAFTLHVTNYRTRQLERDVSQLERQREKLVEEIAILRADRAFLARPGRIEAAARALGMRPADIGQLPRQTDASKVSAIGTPK
ncbi:MAG: hypothetical protein RLZ98_1472 [Pseudomonadota bacterium]|jgi:cell division protein FtsL